ncbi:MAG: GrpB family protein [Hyphomonadaceae bacterium]|nr:GrpB family protein [Hyphomonadaceae bacterium]
MSRKAQVHPHDPRWIDEGLYWADRVRDALQGLALDIDHVGSTAVPGLAAKNALDIQALVFDLDEVEPVVAALAAAGFRHRPEKRGARPVAGYPQDPDCWDQLFFREPEGERAVHLHVREAGTAAARVALLLRDFLRADAMACAQYGALKLGLAAHVKDERAYADLKRPFVAVTLRMPEAWAAQIRWRPGQGDA